MAHRPNLPCHPFHKCGAIGKQLYSFTYILSMVVKNPSARRETWLQSLSWEDSLEKGKATYSNILAWRISMDCIVHGVTKIWTWQKISLSLSLQGCFYPTIAKWDSDDKTVCLSKPNIFTIYYLVLYGKKFTDPQSKITQSIGSKAKIRIKVFRILSQWPMSYSIPEERMKNTMLIET